MAAQISWSRYYTVTSWHRDSFAVARDSQVFIHASAANSANLTGMEKRNAPGSVSAPAIPRAVYAVAALFAGALALNPGRG